MDVVRPSMLRWALGGLLCLTLAACAMREPMRGQEVEGLDRKLSTFAYIEDGDLVTFIVDTQPARDRDGSAYMPLEIALANRRLKKLALTRESFTLIDSQGNRFPMASPRELLEGYKFLDMDRQLAELEGIVIHKFAAFARYPSNFSPTLTAAKVTQDLVVLPKGGYVIDFIYFPTPPGGIRGQRFELFLDSPDLEDPVFVKFEVR